MDNLESNGSSGESLNEPASAGSRRSGDTGISHAPLDLGGGSAVEVPKLGVTEQLVSRAAKAPAEKVVSMERITGVKNFFTKLHIGAITFLDEKITEWLRENPDVVIKRTNVITGELQGKKTEPNIIITIWY